MRLAILGASGHGKVVADAAERSGWDAIAFFDDAWPGVQSNGPWAVHGRSGALIERIHSFDGIIVAIGHNQTRSLKQAELAAVGAKLVTITHPSAIVSPHATVGSGSAVFANAVINASARVGAGVIVNTGAVVEHDCTVEDYSHISPNAVLAGGVMIGSEAWVGACASVRQMVRIGEAAIVGMGAVVTRDVGPGATVIGNPARVQGS